MSSLKSQTSPAWIEVAVANFDHVLVDHAHCEKKAAASAMALVHEYPDKSELVSRCVKLAQEELRHFYAVHQHILRRGLSLSYDRGDPYAKELLKLVRPQRPSERLTDRLLVFSLIEARSCERLGLLAEHLSDPELKTFYARLATAEAGHHRLFIELAKRYDDAAAVDARFEDLARAEAEIVASLPIEPRVH